MAGKFDYAQTDYIDVAERTRAFRDMYPTGSLQPADLLKPYTVETIGDQVYIVVVAAAYRSPDDPRPGIGMAYEAFPGKTPYTRGSELQNAETSAWGRAIVAALAGDTKKGIASANEIRNRQAERELPMGGRMQVVNLPTVPDGPSAIRAQIKDAGEASGMTIGEIAEDFKSWTKGENIATTTDVGVLSEYLLTLTTPPDEQGALA